MKELKIDPELRDLLPPLTDEEFKQLEKNIVENGFDKNFPIMEWNGFIVDGHNRYKICQKHNITDYVIGTLGYETKDQVMEWMLDIQLGRRNLSPIQRIAIAEKYRSLYEKDAQKRLEEGWSKGGQIKNCSTQNFGESTISTNRHKNETNARLAKIANVNRETYRQAKRVLDSDNDDLKQRVLSGETSISTGYKELVGRKENKKVENNNVAITIQPTVISKKLHKTQISDEIKQICTDLKTEKSKEYLDSIWDYRIYIIERMNEDFETYYDIFTGTLLDMNNRVNQDELNECISNAEKNIETLLEAVEKAKKHTVKKEK